MRYLTAFILKIVIIPNLTSCTWLRLHEDFDIFRNPSRARYIFKYKSHNYIRDNNVQLRNDVSKWSGSILDIGSMVAFFRPCFLKKMAFCLLATPKRMSFLTISNENFFFKTQGTRLGAIVAPNRGLEV